MTTTAEAKAKAGAYNAAAVDSQAVRPYLRVIPQPK